MYDHILPNPRTTDDGTFYFKSIDLKMDRMNLHICVPCAGVDYWRLDSYDCYFSFYRRIKNMVKEIKH